MGDNIWFQLNKIGDKKWFERKAKMNYLIEL